MTRQNTLVSRFVQDSGYNYRKDLTEVFDSNNGNIKINVPQHLQNGSNLIDDPALIMETLLLEPKSDDEPSRPQVVVSENGETFSLYHLFGSDNTLDDSSRLANSSRWYEKMARSKQMLSSKPTATFSPTPVSTPPNLSYQHQEQPVTSQQLVMKILENASKAAPSVNSSAAMESGDALIQANSVSESLSTALPLLLSMYNHPQLGASNTSIPLAVSLSPSITSLVQSALGGNVALANNASLPASNENKVRTSFTQSPPGVEERQRSIVASLAVAAPSVVAAIDPSSSVEYVYGNQARNFRLSMPANRLLLNRNTSSGM